MAAFRSSFIAHLTVQSTTKPIETFEDLVNEENWEWGTDEVLLNGGAIYDFFSKHTDPTVQEVLARTEVRYISNASNL